MSPKKAKAPSVDTSKANLVIVESPAKAKTIKKFLGEDFEVAASMGHIVDLPKSGMGVDIEHGFTPEYEVSPSKKSVVSALKKAAKNMQQVWLATDEDREGEAIAWHICNTLDLSTDETPRIVFHEITKDAIQQAVEQPRKIDMDLVDAQQARRVLDRLVGFELSPVLWKKIKPSLSAGRVQSVAVRLLVDREREVMTFKPTSSYSVAGTFTGNKEDFTAKLDKKLDSKKQVDELFDHCADAAYTVKSVEQKPGKKHPSPPFITSTLQQEASRKLGYSVSRTMQLAQRLYEAGHITYMRTDSLNLSGQAIGGIKKFVTEKYGEKYHKARNYTTKSKGAQEAHEAIRPTNFFKQTAGSDSSQKKLYNLIWQKTVASQMAPAQVKKTTITIDFGHKKHSFIAKGEVVTFDGFLKVYGTWDKDTLLPDLSEGDKLDYKVISAEEKHSKPPARYSEAMLVKKLEELGIGRPSTYAPTISTVQKRGYVDKSSSEGEPVELAVATLKKGSTSWKQEKKNTGVYKGKLIPTDIGIVVTDFLLEHFPDIMDYSFTAQVEEQFDTIAEGNLKRNDMINTFYSPFHEQIEEVTEHADRASGERILGKDPKSGKVVKVRIGRYGPLVQIGEQDDDDKQFAPLRGDARIETITLDEALAAFALPRSLGKWNEKEITTNIGRFGPYVKRGDTFASLKPPLDPYEVTKEEAIPILEEKIKKDKERTFMEFEYKDKPGKVLKGRRGPYIKWNRKSIKLPKGTDGAKLTQKEVEEIIDSQTKTKSKTKKKSKKKTTKKKTTKKKSTKKKSTKNKKK